MRKEALRTQRLGTAKLTPYPWETEGNARQGAALLSHWSAQERAAGMLVFQNRQAEVMRMWNTIWEQAFYTKCKEISMESARRHGRSMTSRAGLSSKGSAPHHKKSPSVVSQVSVHQNSTNSHPPLQSWSTYQGHRSPACIRPLRRASLTDKTKGCLLMVVLQIRAGPYRFIEWLFNTNSGFSRCWAGRRVVISFLLPECCHWGAFTNQLKLN